MVSLDYLRFSITARNKTRDFNAPDDGQRPADTSAAMIVASAFLLLSNIESSQSPANSSGADYYKETAVQVCAERHNCPRSSYFYILFPQLVNNATTSFWRSDWQSLLSNGTVNNRADPPINDTGIIYGRYHSNLSCNVF